jgi:hypothetical protein
MKTKNNLAISTIIAVAVAVSILVAFSATASAETINVDGAAVCVVGSGQTDPYAVVYCSIQDAIADADIDDTIEVAAGTYYEVGQIVIDKDLTIVGAGKDATIIKPTQDTTVLGYVQSDAWIYVPSGVTFALSEVTLDGTSRIIRHAIQSRGELTVEDCSIMNIKTNNIYYGRGIVLLAGTSNTIARCEFSDIQRIGIHVRGGVESPNPTAHIEDCTYVGKGDGDWLDYGIEFGGGGSGTVDGCDISACTGVALVDDSTSAGIYATDYFGTGTEVTVVNSILTGNSVGIRVGYKLEFGDATVLTAHCNDICGNIEYGIRNVGTVVVDAIQNWWGDTSGPSEVGSGTGDAVSANVDFEPWSFTPDPCEPKTIGFWKTHGDSVNAVLVLAGDGQIDLGGFTVDDSDDATAVFNNAKNKNANTMLAAQLLAAKLNVLHLAHLGIDYCDGIGTVITAADAFLSGHGYNGPDNPGEAPRGADKQEANGYKDDLDEYNEGLCT